MTDIDFFRTSELVKTELMETKAATAAPEPKTRKQIAVDIFLEKQYEAAQGNQDYPRYIFRIISRSLR